MKGTETFSNFTIGHGHSDAVIPNFTQCQFSFVFFYGFFVFSCNKNYCYKKAAVRASITVTRCQHRWGGGPKVNKFEQVSNDG